MNYCPRQWCVIKITSSEFGTVYKIFGTWGHDQWKLSSGMKLDSLKEEVSCWQSPQESGSTYTLYKDAYTKPSHWAGIYENIIKTVNASNNAHITEFNSFTEVLIDISTKAPSA